MGHDNTDKNNKNLSPLFWDLVDNNIFPNWLLSHAAYKPYKQRNVRMICVKLKGFIATGLQILCQRRPQICRSNI